MPPGASRMWTLGYTPHLRTSLTLAPPVIGNWPHACTWTVTGSSTTAGA